MKTIYLAGGCFWGVEKYFSLVKSVLSTKVGYANGTKDNPSYEDLKKGRDDASIDPYSLGGTDEHSTNWLLYFRVDGTKYRVVKDFTSDEIYIKLKYNDNLIWFK